MEFRELLTDCRNEEFPAKAQRRKEERKESSTFVKFLRAQRDIPGRHATMTTCRLVFFASLRLCGKLLLGFSLALRSIGPTASPDDARRHLAYCHCRC